MIHLLHSIGFGCFWFVIFCVLAGHPLLKTPKSRRPIIGLATLLGLAAFLITL